MSARPERDVVDRARSLAGRTIGEVARSLDVALPTNGHKGFVGSLIERALGIAHRGAGPDLPVLGVEVKTTPIDARGRPRESTFVCMVPRDALDRGWASSHPRAKLARVLFVPVESGPALAARRVGAAFLWSPDAHDEAILAGDWAELSGLMRAGGHEHVSARHGRALQVRPKARRATSRWAAHDADGAPMLALPRAFYLRRAFVASILERAPLAAPEARR